MKYGFVFLILLVCFSACDEGKQTGYTPLASGKPDAMLVLMNQNIWKGETGKTIQRVFAGAFPVLPQPEPSLDIQVTTLASFKKVLKNHHNILLCIIDNDKTDVGTYLNQLLMSNEKLKAQRSDEPFKYFFVKNLWARPQLVTFIIAKDKEILSKELLEKGSQILQRMHRFEYNKIKNQVYNNKRNNEAGDIIEDHFNFSCSIPGNYRVLKTSDQVVWLLAESDKVSMNVVIYTDTQPSVYQNKVDQIIDRRDRILGTFVEGPSKDSYITTDTSVIPAWSRRLTLDGIDVYETRGLWKFSIDFMGGPFVNFTFTNEKSSQDITIEGFVYAPGEEKRKYIRQLEFLLTTMITNEYDNTGLSTY